MRRREFMTLVGGSAFTWPISARAQQPTGMRRIGVLMGWAESDPWAQSSLASFVQGLRQLGWADGGNVRIDYRWARGDINRMRAFAKELVELRPDIILANTTAATVALQRETRTISIVFVIVSDPVGGGFAANLAHPGGNITGFTVDDSALGGKWVELLKEIAPHTERVALLFNPAGPSLQFFMPSIQTAASYFAVQVSVATAYAKDEIEGIIAAQASNPGGGLIVMPNAFNTTNRELIIALAARYGVPTIYFATYCAESGGLIAYGTDYAEQFRQAAGYIDRILKGTKPAELPVQAPTKFELVVNLKTAKALGLTIPPSLLGRANEVIE